MSELPPDLARLGDALTAAAARAAAQRRRRTVLRRRVAVVAVAAAGVLAALAPAELRQAERLGGPVRLAAVTAVAPLQGSCDQPRGARFSVPDRCSVTLLSTPGRLR